MDARAAAPPWGKRRLWRIIAAISALAALGGCIILTTSDQTTSRIPKLVRVTAQQGFEPSLEWRPPERTHSGICVYSIAVGRASDLFEGITHNANWAVAHGASFTLFRSRVARQQHPSWEKAFRARELVSRPECAWVLHIDADAVVVGVKRSPSDVLESMRIEAAPADPALYAACNSPIGRGLDCDRFCCGRAVSRRTIEKRCPVGLMDQGPAAPFPCLINSGVFFVRGGPRGRALVEAWVSKRKNGSDAVEDPFWEQECLNLVKIDQDDWIEVVGGQVLNTHAMFNPRLLRSQSPAAAFDVALRISTGYEPSVESDKRLNHTLYALAAKEAFGFPLGSEALLDRLHSGVGECASDPGAFICHAFAMHPEVKLGLARAVAKAKRPELERLLRGEYLEYRALDGPL